MIRLFNIKLHYMVFVVLGFSIWALLTTFFSIETAKIRGQEPHIGIWLVGGQLIWLYWIIVTPLIVKIVNNLKIDKNSALITFTVHLIVSVLITSLHLLYLHYIYGIPEFLFSLENASTRWQQLPNKNTFINYRFPMGMINYFAIAGVIYAFNFYKRYTEKTIATAKLETELKNSQLLSLKMKLQPHFLFNALNSIVSLIQDNKNPEAAQATLGLSSILRYSLDKLETKEVTLREELEYLKKYTDLEKLRFGDRLQFEYKINDESLQAFVPNLILQPLVENAIRHGIAPSKDGGIVKIRTDIFDDNLKITIENQTGNKQIQNDPDIEQFGIPLTKKRLEHMYGSDYSLDIDTSDTDKYKIVISIPYTTIRLWD